MDNIFWEVTEPQVNVAYNFALGLNALIEATSPITEELKCVLSLTLCVCVCISRSHSAKGIFSLSFQHFRGRSPAVFASFLKCRCRFDIK